MQNYVWGMLTSLFILDILKLNYEKTQKHEVPPTETENFTQPLEPSGMKVKSEDGSEIKIQYEGMEQNNGFEQSEPLRIKILYW